MSTSASTVSRFVLDNGLILLVEEDHTLPRIAYEVRVRGGSCDDVPWAGSGLAHLMEHMLFKGTARRPVGSIEQEVRQYEGYFNAFTSYDYTGYTLQTGSAFVREGLDLLSDVLFHSSFDAQELTKEQGVIRSEMKMNRDQPHRRLFASLWGTAFQVHPYRHPVIGYEEVFNRIQRDDAVAFYRERYVPNNMVIAVAGDVDTHEVKTLAEKLFGEQPRGVPFDWLRAAEPTQLTTRSTLEPFPVQQAQFMLAFHTTRLQDRDLYPLDVLAQILGQGNSARFEQRLRREQQLVHRISAGNATPHDPGLFVISATTEPERVEEAKQAILEELARIRQDGVTASEISRAKRMAESDYWHGRQSLTQRAGDAASNELLVGDHTFSQQYVAGIRHVTATDIQRAAQLFLRPGTWTFAALTPLHAQAAVTTHTDTSTDLIWTNTTLSNGVRVLVAQTEGVPLVAFRAMWAGGLRAEPTGQYGVGHMTAQLLLSGTRRHSAQQIAERVEDRGGQLETFSGKDGFGFALDLLAPDTAFGMDLLKELMTESTFPREELERERARMLADIEAREDSIFNVTTDAFRAALLTDHPYARHPLGTTETVQRLRVDDCIQFAQHYMIPAGLTLAIVGDVDPAQIVSRAREVFGSLPAVATTPVSAVAPTTLTARAERTLFLPERQQAVVVVGFPGVPWTHPDRYAFEVTEAFLAGSGGRLYQLIREQAGLAYTLGAQHVPGAVGGYFLSYVATVPEAAEQVTVELNTQLQRLQQEVPEIAELELAKRSLMTQYYGGLESVGSIAMRAVLGVHVGLSLDELAQYPARIHAVTPADIQRIARTYFHPQQAAQIMTLPESPVANAAAMEAVEANHD